MGEDENYLRGEVLSVGDPEEAWVLNMLPDPTGKSAIWAAKRVPDEHVTITANHFTLREVNIGDKANYLGSANLFSVAREEGWWKEGEEFDFTRAYSTGEYQYQYYSGRRVWRFFELVKPSLKLSSS